MLLAITNSECSVAELETCYLFLTHYPRQMFLGVRGAFVPDSHLVTRLTETLPSATHDCLVTSATDNQPAKGDWGWIITRGRLFWARPGRGWTSEIPLESPQSHNTESFKEVCPQRRESKFWWVVSSLCYIWEILRTTYVTYSSLQSLTASLRKQELKYSNVIL